MQSFLATKVNVPDDTSLDYGEGWLSFTWPDPLYGQEGLTIDLEGHCSRQMPIRSGDGPPQFVRVDRSCILLRFPIALAKKLELDDEVMIEFAMNDQEFSQLQRTVDYFNGIDRG